MAIHTDKEARDDLKVTIGRRLRAARKAATLSMEDIRPILKHKGITQISLAEEGQRMPPLLDLMKYADAYCVPLDWIVGRMNDPIAEAQEHKNALMARAVANGLGAMFSKFTSAMSEHAAIVLSGQRRDRQDLQTAIDAAEEVKAALKKVKQLNPDEYEELRGGATLEAAINKLTTISQRLDARIAHERQQLAMIDRALDIQSGEGTIQQFILEFTSA